MINTKREVLDSYYNREKDFVEEVLKPLFGNMGYEVCDNQGTQEFGKDLILKKVHPLRGVEITVVVAKAVDIANTSKGKATKAVEEVRRQIEQCWRNPIGKFDLKNAIPNTVLVVTCGKIFNNAQVELSQSIESFNKSNTKYFDRDQLTSMIDEHYRELWSYELPVLSKYLINLKGWIESRTMYQSGFKEEIDAVGITCMRRLRTPNGLGKSDVAKPKDTLKPGLITWIQGGTGSGKTFTAWHLCETALKELSSRVGRKHSKRAFRLPVYVKAAALPSFESTTADEFDSWIAKATSTYADDISAAEVKSWIETHGCDLIVDEFERTPAAIKIEELFGVLKSINANSCVLLLSRFTEETKSEFRAQPQVWYLKEINLASASKMIANAASRDGKINIAYQEFIKDGMLAKLPRTPLALNILRLVFEEQNVSLPNNYYEFFEMFFELILGRWEKGRETSRLYDYKQLRTFLQRTAYRMTEKQLLEIPATELVDIAADILSSSAEQQISPEAYIEKIGTIGDICQILDGKFKFVQRTYQEFLTGSEFYQHNWTEAAVMEKFTDLHWEDSIIFAAGAKGRDDGLLAKLPTKSADTHYELFYKMKNIGLLSQALYQSSQAAKEVAVSEGARCAVLLRDHPELIKKMKNFAPNMPDIYLTYTMMKLFGLFYGRTTLQTSVEAVLKNGTQARAGYYLVAALTGMNSSQRKLNIPEALKSIVEGGKVTPESAAIGGFLDLEAKDGGDQFKQIVQSKKVRRMARKTNHILANRKKFVRVDASRAR